MSTTWYAKVDCNIHSNRKVMKAGRLGREVWFFVLCLNAQRGAVGEFPAEDLEPWYVAQQLQMSESEAEQGIAACVKAKLIEFVAGMVSMCGWDPEYGKYPLANAERQKQLRDRRRAKSQSAPVESVASNTNQQGCDTTVTEPSLRSVTQSVTVSQPSNEESRPVTQEGRKEGREGEREALSSGSNQTQVFDPLVVGSVSKLVDKTWAEVERRRQAVARELGLAPPLPMPPSNLPNTPARAVQDLSQRIREEGSRAPDVCLFVIESATAQARKDKSITFLGEKLFTEGGWRTARERVPTWRDASRTEQSSQYVSETRLDDGSISRIVYARNGDVLSAEVIPAARGAVA